MRSRGTARTTLGELCHQQGGAIQTGPFGSQLHASDYSVEGTPVVMPADIVGGRISSAEIARVSTDHVLRLSQHQLQLNDIVFSRRGDVTRFARVTAREVGWLCGTGCLKVRVGDGKTASAEWVSLALGTAEAKEWLVRHAVGATMPNLNTSILGAVPLEIPPLSEQQSAVEILFAFDCRIDLLRQTNATLESIAQALFKSWFIDFDPVRAKAEGREPEGMDAATAALFPAEFEESALGLIPKGWTAGSVYDVASVIYGAPFASKKFNTDGNGQPLVRIRDLRDEAPGVWTPEVHPKGYLIQPGDVVVGMDGEFRAYLWGGELAWLNQRVCCFQPIAPHGAAFVRCSIAAPLAHVEATEVATTVIHLGKGDIDRFKVVVPTAAVAKAFSELTVPLYARIVANKAQGRNLAAARDTLLPRLISGKLRLPEAQALIDEVAA